MRAIRKSQRANERSNELSGKTGGLLGRFKKSREIRNSLWIIGESVLQALISLVIGVLSARYLGPSNFGALNYTASFVAFVTAIATLSMEGVVVKKLVYKPDDEGLYLGSCMLFRFWSAVFSTFAITFAVYVLNPNEPIKIALVLLQSLQLIFKAPLILDSWFQRHLKSKYVSIGKMIACLIVSSYKIYLLVTMKSLVWFAFSNSLTDLVIAVMLYAFYKRQLGQKMTASRKIGAEVLRESYHFIISGLMVAIYGQIAKILLGGMLTDADVGLFTTATSVSAMWIFVPTAIINSFRPMVMECKKSGNERAYIRRLEQLYSGIIWLCVLVSIVVALIAPFAVRLLFGEAYAGASNALRIIIWSETFSMIGCARGIWILCENKNKYVKYYLMIGAVVNVALNSAAIPLWGINGAAWATLITQIMTSVIAPLFFRETRVHTKIVLEAATCKWFFVKT